MNDRTSPSGPQRYRAMSRVFLVVLLLGIAMAAAKGVYGAFSGSLGMVASGIDSATDAMGAILGLVGVHIASRPPGPTHPYGYERYEPLAAMGIAGLMVLAVVEILQEAWDRIMSPVVPTVTPVSFAIMVGTVAVTLGVALWERRRSRELASTSLQADARRSMSDTMVAASVIVGLVAVRLGLPLVDTLVSVAVAGVVAWTAWGVVWGASAVLTDAAVGDPKRIAEIAANVEGVKGVHQVRSRGVAGMVRVDLHITVDPNMRVDDAHHLAEEVDRRVRREIGGTMEVLVHVGSATMHDDP